MKKLIWTLFITATFSNLVMASGKELYKNCAGCHGEHGEKKALQTSGIIGGQASDTTINELTAYKNGELNQYGLGNIMKMQLILLKKEDINDLATYISQLTLSQQK